MFRAVSYQDEERVFHCELFLSVLCRMPSSASLTMASDRGFIGTPKTVGIVCGGILKWSVRTGSLADIQD